MRALSVSDSQTLAFNHDPAVVKVDTVKSWHIGTNLLAEIHIVLPEDMMLRDAHEIGEALEIKIERLDWVERAFVHLDYEWSHKPEHNGVARQE